MKTRTLTAEPFDSWDDTRSPAHDLTVSECISAGRFVILEVPGEIETAGYLVIAAEHLNTQAAAFMIERTDGYLCVAMPGDDLDRLHLPPMTDFSESADGADYAVSVDAIDGVSTGISAHDRARTIRALADPATTPTDLTRPGHVVPIRTGAGDSSYACVAEVAVSLMRASGVRPVAALAAILDARGEVADHDALVEFAVHADIPLVSTHSLNYRRPRPQGRISNGTGTFQTRLGSFRTYEYKSPTDGTNKIAIARIRNGCAQQ